MSRRKQKLHKDLDPDMGVVTAAEEPREKETITKGDVGEIDLEEGTFRQITEKAEESWLDDAIKEEVEQEEDSEELDIGEGTEFKIPIKPQYGLPATSPMTPKWPTESLIMDWPWGDEPDPQIGEVVGWNWECNQVAVVTVIPMIQGSYPWRVTIEVQQLTEPRVVNLLGIDNTVPVIHHPLWYTKWNRAGEMELLGEVEEDTGKKHTIRVGLDTLHGRYVAVIVSE